MCCKTNKEEERISSMEWSSKRGREDSTPSSLQASPKKVCGVRDVLEDSRRVYILTTALPQLP